VLAKYSDPSGWKLATRVESDLAPNEAHYYVEMRNPTGYFSCVFMDWVYMQMHKGAAGWCTSAGNLATYFGRLFNFPFSYNGALPGNQATVRVFPNNLAFAFVTNYRSPAVDTNAVVQQRMGPLIESYAQSLPGAQR
jgi:hypothetical protein